MIELLPIHTCRKRTQMRAQENENFFIPCVDTCVCICVGVVHKSNSLHLHLRLHFEVIDWPREVWVLILLPSLEINSTFQSWPNTNITRTSNRCVSLELKNISDKWLENAKNAWIWCVQAMSNCFAKKDYVQSVFAFFQSILRDWELKWGKEPNFFCNSGEIKVQLAYTNTLLFYLDRETEFCCYRHWQSWQLAVIKIAIMI